MDVTDYKILSILQDDASLSVAEIATRVNLSQTPAWRRIQRLEEQGVIERRVAILNPESIGLGRFAGAVAGMPEVMEVYRMAGDVDYLLRIAVKDMAAYDAFYRRLIELVPLKNVTSRFAMERVKSTTAYPLPSPARAA
jgi:Lrp/AsnC family transcriptional regulator